MKNILTLAAVALLAVILGMQLQRWMQPEAMESTAGPANDEPEQPLYWVAPMDKNFRRDQPGKSPMGMDLVPVYASELNSAGGKVQISANVAHNLGVRTVTVGRTDIPRLINTVGFIGYNEESIEHIHTRADGWIEKLGVAFVGQQVTTSQLLFSIYSPTLVNAQDQYLAAVESGQDVLVNASAQRLRGFGLTGEDVLALARRGRAEDFVNTHAERPAWVAELLVREGMYVTPGKPIMNLVDLSSVWMLVDVLERQAAWVETGQSVTARLDAHPGREFSGSVDYVYPELNRDSRTLPLRLRFDNPELELKPNMYARVEIETEIRRNALCVPLEAVIRGANEARVIIALGEGRFRAQRIQMGLVSGQHVEVLEGLEAGQSVVVSGQFLLDSEASQEAEFRRLDDSSEAP